MTNEDTSSSVNIQRLMKLRDNLRSSEMKAKAAFSSPTALVGGKKKALIAASQSISPSTNTRKLIDKAERRDDDVFNQISLSTSVNIGWSRSRSRSNTPVKRHNRSSTPDAAKRNLSPMSLSSRPSSSFQSNVSKMKGESFGDTPNDATLSPKREVVAENERLAFEVERKSEPNNETDLKFDDESFQVIANMVLDHLQPKVSPADNSYILTKEELQSLESSIALPIRKSFTEAMRFRAGKSNNEESFVYETVSECVRLGLDRPDERNILLGGGQKIAGERMLIPVSRQCVYSATDIL